MMCSPTCSGSRLEIRLAAVLWRFLGQHEAHVAEAADVPRFDIVTTVPGTRQRDDDHPLVRIVGTLVGQTRGRYQPVLALGPDASVEGRAVLVNRYRATQAMTGHPSVLLVDDTWTTGGRAQSAAIALHDAGAASVAVVVLGRHFDRSFGSGETYYLSWAILVRKSGGAVDGVEGLAQVVGDGVGGGDGLPSGLDLDGAVAAGCPDEFPG